MIPAEITKWIVLILAIGLVIFVIKAGMKLLNILLMVLLLGFCWYSFFTEEGAARLSIVCMGKPVTAYTTKLTKDENKSTKTISYFKSSKDVIVKNKKKEYIICYTKWIVRIPAIEE